MISCLHSYFMGLPAEVSILYLYSDGCPGQNRNVHMMKYLLLSKGWTIPTYSTSFPICGYSFLPNGRDFRQTETKKEVVECVYTFDKWYHGIRASRRRFPFVINTPSQEDVKDFAGHLALFFKKTISIW